MATENLADEAVKEITNMGSTFERLVDILKGKMAGWVDGAVAMLPNMILALLVFIAFYKIGDIAKNILGRILSRTSNNVSVNRLLQAVLYTIIVSVGFFTALGILHLEKAVTSLLAGAGVLGLAIGFAFQEIAANFFSGILIAFKKPYQIGDYVEVDGGAQKGTVSEISLRTTNLTTDQGLEVIIPNKDMFTKTLVNYTFTPERRVDITVGVSYAEDLRRVESITLAALENVAFRIMEKPITFFYIGFGPSSIDFRVSYWVHFPGDMNFPKSTHEAIILIKEAFDRNEISIPFPIQTLDFGIKGGVSLPQALTPQQVPGPFP